MVLAMRDKIIERGIADADELKRVDAEVRALLADPDSLTMPHLALPCLGRISSTKET